MLLKTFLYQKLTNWQLLFGVIRECLVVHLEVKLGIILNGTFITMIVSLQKCRIVKKQQTFF